jgi:hypothetical protein
MPGLLDRATKLTSSQGEARGAKNMHRHRATSRLACKLGNSFNAQKG